MKHTLSIILALAFFFVNAQSHQEAKDLLEKSKKATQAFKNYKIEFKNSITSPTGNEAKPTVTRSMEGTIYVKGDTYRLILNDMVYINDGKHMYIVDPEIEEVDKMELDEEAPLTPTAILSEFDKNYSYKLGDKKNRRRQDYSIHRFKAKWLQ